MNRTSPLNLEILLHYYYAGDEYRGREWNADKLAEMFALFHVHYRLLEPVPEEERSKEPVDYIRATYRLTARGKFYVESLLNMPLPVSKFFIPFDDSVQKTFGLLPS